MMFKGYWPDETESEMAAYQPWEEFSLVLWGSEVGDYVTGNEDVKLTLARAGYEIVRKSDGKIYSRGRGLDE